MAEFIKQGGIDHIVQRLYIHWDITTMCQYKCSYCYAMKEYKDKWFRPGNYKKQLEVIDTISKSKLPVFLGLLGGEPTMHHKFLDLVTEINNKILQNHDESEMYITTNLASDISKYEEFFDNSFFNYKCRFLVSFHAEYENDIDLFVNKIKLLMSKNFRVKVNIMMHPSKKYWNNISELINKVQDISNDNKLLNIHPHYIYSSPHKTVKYSSDFYETFSQLLSNISKDFIFEDDIGNTQIYNDTYIFENKLNKFKNWNCFNNNFEINLQCEVNQFCFEDKHEMDSNYFAKIDKIYPKKCAHDFCSCDGLLKIKKEK